MICYLFNSPIVGRDIIDHTQSILIEVPQPPVCGTVDNTMCAIYHQFQVGCPGSSTHMSNVANQNLYIDILLVKSSRDS